MRTWIQRTVFGLACMALGASLTAQVSPVGPEFQVNTFAVYIQHHSSVDFDGAGNFVVVWDDQSFFDPDRVYLQRFRARKFSPDGQPAGTEFAHFEYLLSGAPSLAVQDGGEFGVVTNIVEPTNASEVWGWLFDSQVGLPNGPLQINSVTSSFQSSASVADAPDGGYVVVWQSNSSGGTDSSGMSVQMRRFTAIGLPISGDFQVNTYTTGDQDFPQVGVHPGGDFVVAWQSQGLIRARRFDSVGEPASDEFQVNVETLNGQRPVVASLADGGFVIAWQSEGSSGGDSSGRSIQARLYSASGAPLAEQFQVNSYSDGHQFAPAAAADSTGTLAISWTSVGSGATDSSATSVQARRYRVDGSALTDEFQVNSYTTNGQYGSAISFSPDGDFVVTWTSHGSTGGDTDFTSIQARQFQGLFADGFADGTTLRWSLTLE